jgi:hypothetical protein
LLSYERAALVNYGPAKHPWHWLVFAALFGIGGAAASFVIGHAGPISIIPWASSGLAAFGCYSAFVGIDLSRSTDKDIPYAVYPHMKAVYGWVGALLALCVAVASLQFALWAAAQ